jgi:hypothetical protein
MATSRGVELATSRGAREVATTYKRMGEGVSTIKEPGKEITFKEGCGDSNNHRTAGVATITGW